MDKIKMHQELCDLIHETYLKKNADYGDSFGRSIDRLGLIAAITRISDKYNRAENLIVNNTNSPLVSNESLKDTLLDMANYCIMTVIELEKNGN
jgi:hypothetical protein|nr:MAG TPA: Nucleotide modification associated domain 1 [Caudoviricetes sp.]